MHKLSPKYYGPFQISERIRTVAYKLQLPSSAKIHLVFHVSLLKKKLGQGVVVHPHLPPIIDPENPRWYPAAVLDISIFKKRGNAITKWLIHWVGTSVDDATWEVATEIIARYPDFQA